MLEDDDREPLAPRGEVCHRAGGVRADHPRALAQAQPLDVVAQRAQRGAVLLDEGGGRRAAREGLDADPARAREQVEKRAALEIRHQGVEAGDADLVRGRPRGAPARRGETLALERPREDAHQGVVSDGPSRRPSTLHCPPSRSSAYSTRSHPGLCSVPPVASTTNTTRDGLRRIWSTRKSENCRSTAPLAWAYSSTWRARASSALSWAQAGAAPTPRASAHPSTPQPRGRISRRRPGRACRASGGARRRAARGARGRAAEDRRGSGPPRPGARPRGRPRRAADPRRGTRVAPTDGCRRNRPAPEARDPPPRS